MVCARRLGSLTSNGLGRPRADVAEPAAARACVAHDHEGSRALAPTFTDVGTRRLFADRHQLVAAHGVLDRLEAAQGYSRLHPNPVRFCQSCCRVCRVSLGL